NVQNYMEYAYCSKMFTYGQRAQMWYSLNSTTAERYKLWQPGNLAATGCLGNPVTCAPKADFHPNRRMVCEGTVVTLNDKTWNGTPTTWNWTVTGPANFSSTQQNPQFTFNTVGSYDVKLVVSNAQGTDSISKGQVIIVSSDYAVLNAQYTESFEDPNAFYLGYVSNNRYGNASYFQRNTWTGATGSASVFLNNHNNTIRGDVDEFVTPSYYLSYLTNLQFEFKYAYATGATAADWNTQSLKVYTSIDCGQNWILRWTKSGSQLVTGGFTPNFYVPVANDWATITIPLPSNCAAPNVRFKFEFTSPADETGNNLFIDDININAAGVGINDPSTGSAFSIYPNPGDGNSTIAYTLEKESNVKAELLDVTGRLIREIHSGSQAAGQHQLPVSDEPLAVGTYLIRMVIDEKVTTQKYVVTE
ncbi:MAG TPA: PKD domain-containing protein, partial [Bacteroidia bacterium]|nr:PKD domain-containing protein [Bacteroidia bacterium]